MQRHYAKQQVVTERLTIILGMINCLQSAVHRENFAGKKLKMCPFQNRYRQKFYLYLTINFVSIQSYFDEHEL